jgi:hypothetical protein
MPYDCHQVGVSTFTMADNGDAFTKFLAKWGYVRAATWNKSPVYHIKVVVSKMGLLSEFFLDPIQVKKVSTTLCPAQPYDIDLKRSTSRASRNFMQNLTLINEIGSRLFNATR